MEMLEAGISYPCCQQSSEAQTFPAKDKWPKLGMGKQGQPCTCGIRQNSILLLALSTHQPSV